MASSMLVVAPHGNGTKCYHQYLLTVMTVVVVAAAVRFG